MSLEQKRHSIDICSQGAEKTHIINRTLERNVEKGDELSGCWKAVNKEAAEAKTRMTGVRGS